MEKLRQALKTLSEAEKQLRMSNDRLTWLTAALLQLAPDPQYILPSSSGDTSFNHSPLDLNNVAVRDRPRKSSGERAEVPKERGLSTRVRKGNVQTGNAGGFNYSGRLKGTSLDTGTSNTTVPQQAYSFSSKRDKVSSGQLQGKFRSEIEVIWLDVLRKIQGDSLREFLFQEGKLISVSFGAGIFTTHCV